MSAVKARILIVEDEADIRELLVLHLQRDGHQVETADTGESGLRLLESREFGLAVLDWMLPGISGLELCKKFHGRLPILMLTARADSSDIVLGLEMGADDYVVKPFEIPVFLARVRALLRRGPQLRSFEATKNYEVAGLRVSAEEHRAWCDGKEVELTVSEFKLLLALLENQGRVLSRDRLIDQVQGAEVNVTPRTIDTHVFGLRKKLGPCGELIETIRGVGYRVSAG